MIKLVKDVENIQARENLRRFLLVKMHVGSTGYTCTSGTRFLGGKWVAHEKKMKIKQRLLAKRLEAAEYNTSPAQ